MFDHPEVRIWRKVRDVDRDTIVAVLDPIAAANAVAIDPTRASANGLLLTDDEIATNATGPTYDQAFDTDGSNVLHVIGWFLLLELLGVAAFALFAPLLQSLPDAGWGLAKILALGTLAFALFIAAAWLHVDLDRTSVGVITAAFVAAGAVCAIRRRAAPVEPVARAASCADHRRGAVHADVPRVRPDPGHESRPVAPGSRRREAVRAWRC